MSDGENQHHGKNEIIIIKRHGGGDHDGHHGGAWKIAFADFMTAMMAFFLVMWLVNAANEETKASVASYFNPIKLADETPAKKGLRQPLDQAEGELQKASSTVEGQEQTKGTDTASGEAKTASSGDATNYSEADLFENPYSVLAEIAQEVGQQANVSAKGEGGAADSGPATGADGGAAYRDPFDPDFWTRQVQMTRSEPTSEQADVTVADAGEAVEKQPDTRSPAQTQAGLKVEDNRLPEPKKPQTGKKAEAAAKAEKAQAEKAAGELRQSIEQQIAGVSGKLAESLMVTPSEGGLLITLSDRSDAAMFNIGSAVPQREMVLAMEKIGQILDERKGSIVIRGHTDGRQFKDGANDNWRLSMARAHAAYYMLLRGGLNEGRVDQVSGFADRRLQVLDNPLADSNRRIEILVEGKQG